MKGTAFWVRPLDTLFAGPPHSATAGESSGNRSQFPLPSSTFQGLVRTRLLTGASEELDLSPKQQHRIERLIGTPTALPPGWQLEGPFPVEQRIVNERLQQRPWLPTPRFLFVDAQDKPVPAQVLGSFGEDIAGTPSQLALNDLVCEQGASPLYLLGPRQPASAKVKPLGGWISADKLKLALAGTLSMDAGAWNPQEYGEDFPPFVQYERRAGVAIDPHTGVAQDQMLFFLESLRFATGSGFAGVLQAPPLPAPLTPGALQTGIGYAGKAARAVAFEPLTGLCPSWMELWSGQHLTPERLEQVYRLELGSQEDLFVWLVLLTPLWLEEANRPVLKAAVEGISLEVRGALLGDLITQGGFDRTTHHMRLNRQLVPGGSCWLVRVSGGSLAQKAEVLGALNARHPLGHPSDTTFGQGLMMVGLAPHIRRNS